MEYIIAFILSIIGIAYNKHFSNRLRLFYIGIIYLYVILIIGLRYRVGLDTLNYMSSYAYVPSWKSFVSNNIWENRFEPGYMIICILCKSITPDFWLLQLTMALITNGCVFIFIHRYCKNPFVGIFLYFIFQCMYFSVEIIRESAAIGIFLINYRNIENKKWLKYYVISLLSISFHFSAIIIWLFPLVKYIRLNLLYILLCIGILCVTPLIEKINSLFIIASITGRIEEQLTSIEALNLNWRIIEFIKTGIPAILTLIITHKFNLPQRFKCIILLQILLCLGTFEIPIIFARFINYTSLFVTISLSNIFSSNRITYHYKCILFCVILLTQAKYLVEMYRAWNPYISIINKEIIKEREELWWIYFH